MGETGKTVTYVGIALALGLLTILARPRQEFLRAPDAVGKALFEKFTDPTKASRLQVVRYAEELGEVYTFEVAKNAGGLWTIPSHGHYPADAQNQMKDAANVLIGLTVLDVASEDQQDHELYGVLEPNQEKLKAGDKGVGLLVSFRDDKGEPLGRLIIGKQVKGSTEQRFVRVPGQDPVYVVKVNTDKLSTKFEDWIEKDLLKLSAFDVEGLRVKDYSVVPTSRGYGMQPRSEIAVAYNSNDAKWNLEEMKLWRGSTAENSDLLPNEELNKEKLDEVKNSLGSVHIVDVFAKPEGLGATLKATGKFADALEARRSLEQRGFILDDKQDLLAANGELHVTMKDGVQYLLRFGNVAGEEQDSSEGKLNRYLFVTAQLDESKFPPPQLEALPGGETPSADPAVPNPAAPGPAAAPATDAVPPPAGTLPPAPAVNPASADSVPPAPPATPAKEGDGGDEDELDEEANVEEEQDKAAEEKTSEEKAELNAPANPPADEKPAAEKPADAEPPATPAAAATETPATPEKPSASEDELKKKKLEVERERITKENQRKLDEWREKKQKAEEKVREANARFADWYYVISEDVYKKLHLSRSDIIRESAKAAEEGTGVDAFRKLEQDGLKK